MIEIAAAIELGRARLRAHPDLAGISVEPQQDEARPTPGIILGHSASRDSCPNKADILFSDVDLRVIYRAPGALDQAKVTIGRAIHQALHDQSGIVGSGEIYACFRVTSIYFPKKEGDGQFWHYLGGVYRFSVRGA